MAAMRSAGDFAITCAVRTAAQQIQQRDPILCGQRRRVNRRHDVPKVPDRPHLSPYTPALWRYNIANRGDNKVMFTT
jgi:hypothetical protein